MTVHLICDEVPAGFVASTLIEIDRAEISLPGTTSSVAVPPVTGVKTPEFHSVLALPSTAFPAVLPPVVDDAVVPPGSLHVPPGKPAIEPSGQSLHEHFPLLQESVTGQSASESMCVGMVPVHETASHGPRGGGGSFGSATVVVVAATH